MATQTRTVLKAWFQTGDSPTEAQFIDLIDSLLALAAGESNAVAGDSTFSGQVIVSHASGPQTNVISERTGGSGVTADGVLLKDGGATLTEPLVQQEENVAPSTPASGYRVVYPKDTGGLHTTDDGGYEYALAFAGGNVASLIDEPRPASWQHKDAATGSAYGDLRIEWGRDTLAAGTKAITFQQAFSALLEVFLVDKTAANVMYPGALGTTGFTANGTGADTFGWLALGYDGR